MWRIDAFTDSALGILRPDRFLRDGSVGSICFIVLILLKASPAAAAEVNSSGATSTNSVERLKTLMGQLEVPNVEPQVEAVSKYEQRASEAPALVTVVTAEEVKRYGYRTLADLLRSVPGLDVTYDRNYAFLGVQGFNRLDYNSRVLLLVDGHRINNGLSDGAFIDKAFILDPDLIKQVEVVSGPGSVLYGNNAMFGVINVITRRGGDIHGLEVSGWGGSQDTGHGRITIGDTITNGPLEGLDFIVSGSLYESQGAERLFFKEFNSPQFNHGNADNGDDDHSKSLFTSVSYRDILTFEGGYVRREKGNPTAPFAITDTNNPAFGLGAAFDDPRTRTIDQRAFAALKFAYDLPWELRLTARLYFDWSDFEGVGVYNRPPGLLDPIHNLQSAEWWGSELQVDKVVFDRHHFTLGGEFRDDFDQQSHTFDGLTHTSLPVTHRSRQSEGVYFQGDLGFFSQTNLHLNAGVRYDKYGDFSGTANPRVALIYSPFEQTTFKGIYGTAFRVPNFFEIGRENPSLGLKPEKITTYELIYEQGFAGHLRSSISGFYNDMSDLISLLPDPLQPGTTSYQNVHGADARGVELALQGNWANGIRGRVSYTFQKTRDKSTGAVLTDSPEDLFKFNLSVPVLKEKIFASAEFQYTSSRTTLLGTQAGGFGVLNLTLFSQNLLRNLELSVSVYNVLDRRYNDPATPFHIQDVIPQDGRLVYGKLTYRF